MSTLYVPKHRFANEIPDYGNLTTGFTVCQNTQYPVFTGNHPINNIMYHYKTSKEWLSCMKKQVVSNPQELSVDLGFSRFKSRIRPLGLALASVLSIAFAAPGANNLVHAGSEKAGASNEQNKLKPTNPPVAEEGDGSKVQSANQRHRMPHDQRKAAAVRLKAKYEADRAQKMAEEVNKHAQIGGE